MVQIFYLFLRIKDKSFSPAYHKYLCSFEFILTLESLGFFDLLNIGQINPLNKIR